MITHKLISENGHFYAFEIDNAYIGLKQIEALLSSVEGVKDVGGYKLFKTDDVRIEFHYFEQPFVVWEPFGDNSRYWIGPKDERLSVNLDKLESAFSRYKPNVFRKILGDLLTLNVKSLLKT